MTARTQIIPVFVPHLGCPKNCVFCNQRKISGSLQPATAETVRTALVEGLSKLPENSNTQLAFYGGSFTAIPVEKQNALLDAALPFLRAGRLSSLRVSTRPDAIDEETLKRLRAYGVQTIELGAQSMCDAVLQASNRGHRAEDTEQAARRIKDFGFTLILQMMTGLPGDTAERALKTAERLIALKPDGVRIYPTVVIADTPLEALWRAGLYREHSLEEAVSLCALLLPLFDAAGIPVIRLGLNPTDELSGGEALAGAYHPAFGELVRSRLLLERARTLFSAADRGGEALLLVHPSDISPMVGQKRGNLLALKTEFSLKSLHVRGADLQKGEVRRVKS